MARRRRPRQNPLPAPLGDLSDPEGLPARMAEHLEWLEVHHYSEQTVVSRRNHLRRFAAWCAERGIERPVEITLPILERFQRHLYLHRKKDGQPLSFRHQRSQLTIVRGFFRWLTRQRYLLSNPASELELPKIERRLPKHVLNLDEVEEVLSQPDVSTPFGIRDRAMLEVLYSTGIRRMELGNLRRYDLDAERGTLFVRQGKGKKDRMIPIGERAMAWVEKYLTEVRPTLVIEPDDGTVFLTRYGEPFPLSALSQLVHRYVERSDVEKEGACHLFRHTMATLMLEGGADVRFIQAMLGHADLSSTEIYTQVSIRKLKEIHAATHPGAKLRGPRSKRSGDS